MFSKICDLKIFPKLPVSNCAYSLELYQRPATLLKELRCNICEFFNNTFFEEHLRATAFIIGKKNSFYCSERTVILWKSLFEMTIYFYGTLFPQNVQKQLSGVFYKKGVPTKFTKFTGKHLCQSLVYC